MANKRSRRRSSGFVAIPVQGSFALTTLADQAVLSADLFSAALTEDLFVISTEITAQIRGVTAGEGDPSTLGLAHGDYQDTEIAEALTVKLLGPGNKIEQERARRLVRKIGVFQASNVNVETELKMIGKGGSPNPKTKVRFVIQSAKTMKIWIQNRSGGVLTTGQILEFDGMVYGRWIL